MSVWNDYRIKDIASYIGSGTTPSSKVERYYNSEDYHWINTGDFNDNNVYGGKQMISSAAISENPTLRFYPEDTVLVAMYGASIGKVGMLKVEATVNQACCAIMPNKHLVLPYFLFYAFVNQKDTLLSKSFGGTQPNVSQRIISNLLFRFPSLDEQKRIVDYLDAKLSEIDKRVSVLEKQLDAYARLKKSIIHQAVTRGLNPDVRLKDSGIEWIGMIPKHWKTIRFKNTYNKSNVGESIDKEYNSDNVEDRLFYTAGIKPLHSSYKEFPQWKFTNSADLLLARNGTPYVYLPVCDSLYSDHIIRVDIRNEYYKDYVRYCLQLAISNEIVDSVSIATWSISIWERQIIPLPPFSEQHAIAEYLDEKCAKIDAAIENIGKQIDASKRLKRAIINEAISGKTII